MALGERSKLQLRQPQPSMASLASLLEGATQCSSHLTLCSCLPPVPPCAPASTLQLLPPVAGPRLGSRSPSWALFLRLAARGLPIFQAPAALRAAGSPLALSALPVRSWPCRAVVGACGACAPAMLLARSVGRAPIGPGGRLLPRWCALAWPLYCLLPQLVCSEPLCAGAAPRLLLVSTCVPPRAPVHWRSPPAASRLTLYARLRTCAPAVRSPLLPFSTYVPPLRPAPCLRV